jgi:hypothetical protein
MKFTWYGDKATSRFMAKLADNLDDAGRELAQRVRDKISIEGPPRSSPGNPPHVDTGELVASYGHDTDPTSLTTVVGSDVPYSAYLESGTPTMAPRPHLTDTLIESADDLSRIVAKP